MKQDATQPELVTLTVRLERDTYKALKDFAWQNRRSLSGQVRAWIDEAAARLDEQEAAA